MSEQNDAPELTPAGVNDGPHGVDREDAPTTEAGAVEQPEAETPSAPETPETPDAPAEEAQG